MVVALDFCRITVRVRGHQVIGNDIFQEIKPEQRKLREHVALVRNARGEHVVKGRDAVGGYKQQLFAAHLIYVAHFAAGKQLQFRKICLEKGGIESLGSHAEYSMRKSSRILAAQKILVNGRNHSRTSGDAFSTILEIEAAGFHAKSLLARCYNGSGLWKYGPKLTPVVCSGEDQSRTRMIFGVVLADFLVQRRFGEPLEIGGVLPSHLDYAVAPSLTDTSFDTPGSCMVTPYSTGAMLIVFLLWVISTNCVCTLISRTSSMKRPMLASSSGASTSSRMQNGLGWYWKIPTSSESAVIAFSPPESSNTFCNRFPGGDATTSMPLSALFSSSVSRMNALPPPNSFLKVTWKFWLIWLNASSNFCREKVSISLMVATVFSIDWRRSFRWVSRNACRSAVSLYSSSAIMLTGPIESWRARISWQACCSVARSSPDKRGRLESAINSVRSTPSSFRQVCPRYCASDSSFTAAVDSSALRSRRTSSCCRASRN